MLIEGKVKHNLNMLLLSPENTVIKYANQTSSVYVNELILIV